MSLFRRERPVAKEAPPAGPAKFVELGNFRLHQADQYRPEEFLTNLKGQRASQVFNEMMSNDPLVHGVLFAITASLRSVEWTVEPASASEADIAAADFVHTCMGDMSETWEEFIQDALSFLPYGFAALEVVWKHRGGTQTSDPTRHSRFDDGRVGWRRFSLIPQYSVYKFQLDDHGGVQGLTQRGTGTGGNIELPIWKLLLFRTDRRSPWGTSVLRSAYSSYYYKSKLEKIESIGAERDLVGMPVMYVDPDALSNTTRRAEYQEIVRNLRVDEQHGVLLPAVYNDKGNPLYKLELLASGGSKALDLDKVIGRHNRGIAMSLLQDTILLGHERVGTQSLAVEKQDLSRVALQAWANELESVINEHAVPDLLALNGFDVANRPRIVHGAIGQPEGLQFSEILRNLGQAGFIGFDEPAVDAEVRRRVGLPQAQEG